MSKFFSVFLLMTACLSLTARELTQKEQYQVQVLEEQIQELREQRAMYQQRAEEQEIDAERLQFEGEFFDDAQVDWNNADENRKKAAELKVQIQRLEKQKELILSGKNR